MKTGIKERILETALSLAKNERVESLSWMTYEVEKPVDLEKMIRRIEEKKLEREKV